MGLYDSLIVECPKCGYGIEFQSKAGECSLNRYSINNVPSKIAEDLNNNSLSCYRCGKQVVIHITFELKPIVSLSLGDS